MPHTASITLHASSARAASGVGSVIDMGSATTAELLLDIIAASGTLLDVTVETARTQAATTWRVVGAFGSAAAVQSQAQTFAGLDRWIRVRWTVVGGSFTFAVSGNSVLVYCTPNDMRRVIAEQSLIVTQDESYTDADLDGFAQDATDEASGSLAAMFTLPLSAWGRDVRRKTAELGVYYSMTKRGYSPEEPSGKALRTMFDDVQRWLGLVRDQKIELQHIVDATPDVEDGGAYIVTSARRGWGDI